MTKHAVSLDALASGKQVDRLLSNHGTDVWDRFVRWVLQQVGAQPDIPVAMDWTDFDHDGQLTLALSLVTGRGRAAPLIWLTVWKEEIATGRNDYEDACLVRLAETMPAGCGVTILADHGLSHAAWRSLTSASCAVSPETWPIQSSLPSRAGGRSRQPSRGS